DVYKRQAVDIHAGYIAVGSPGSDLAGSENGAVRVFRHNGASWSWSRTFYNETQSSSDADFGFAVAIGDDRLAVGAPGEWNDRGLVHMYERSGSAWSFDSTLAGSDTTDGHRFGEAVAVSGDAVVAGAPKNNPGVFQGGAAYLLQHSGVAWHETKLVSGDIAGGDYLGRAVAIDGMTVFAGAPYHDTAGLANSGAVYVFDVEMPTFTPFVMGDGSGADCPCSNESSPGSGRGCGNSTGDGALLGHVGGASVQTNDLALNASGLPANQPALLFMGTSSAGGAPFGDGLLGINGFLVRLEIRSADAAGNVTWPQVASLSNASNGDYKLYQVWYRDPLGTPCGTPYNLTNGLQVAYQQ
ncbi:MAG: FG-GAP repeat protein, partial [Gammaproteobacteria bacterium]|nr:FG-GAP repeat protein [Gammaproteobacteria bacterium]